MQVKELMTVEVAYCSPEDSLAHAAGLMAAHSVSCLPVVEEDGRVVSVVTARDLCVTCSELTASLEDLCIAQAMSNELVWCSPDEVLWVVEQRMRRHHVWRLPVLKDEQLVGLLSLTDIARAWGSLPARADDVSADEVASTLAAVLERPIELGRRS